MADPPSDSDVRARYYAHLEDRNKQILAMHQQGAPAPMLARAFGLSRITVHRLLRKAKRGHPIATLGTARD